MLTDQSLSAAVQRALAYAAVFHFPGNQHYVWRFLSSRLRVTPKKLRNIPAFSRLPVVLAVTTVDCQKWRAVAQAVRLIAWVPWVRGIWVTGALAAGSTLADDDLDFLILTDPQRLWLTRALVVGLGFLSGHYRSHWLPANQLANRWCCNLWLEPSALALPVNRRTLYEARELVQAVPVYCRPGERATVLLEHNPWVREYLANGYHLAYRRAECLAPGSIGWPDLPVGWLAAIGNRVLYRLQRRFMARRVTRETILVDRAFFHPRDTRSWVRARYETICHAQGIDPCFTAPAP